MYCPKCGAENKNSDKFCGRCGFDLQNELVGTGPSAIAENYDSIREIKSRGERNFNIKIALVVILALVFMAAINLGYKNHLIDSTTKVNKAIQGNNVQPKINSNADNSDIDKNFNVGTDKPTTGTHDTAVQSNDTDINKQTVSDANWESAKKDLAKGGASLKEAVDEGCYNPKELVAINRSLLTMVMGARTGIDDYIYSQGKYYLVIDFTIINALDNSYSSSVYDFSLTDSLGYTYDPTITFSTIGSLEGDIKAKGSKRGEIAFEVLGNQRQFILHYNTKAGFSALKSLSGDAETINYKIDFNTLILKQQNQQDNSNNVSGG